VHTRGRTHDQGCAREVREAVDLLPLLCRRSDRLFHKPVRLPVTRPARKTIFAKRTRRTGLYQPMELSIAIFSGKFGAARGRGNTVMPNPRSNFVDRNALYSAYAPGWFPTNVLQFLRRRDVDSRTLLRFPVLAASFLPIHHNCAYDHRQLAQHQPAIVPLIAETGGQNVMIADSSAHIESAGTGCGHFGLQQCPASAVRLKVLLSRKTLPKQSSRY